MKFQLVDLEEIAKMAKTLGIRTIVDNTWATPLFQKPIPLGIDIVVHSTSKYLGGHNDVLGGALITSNQIMKTIFEKEYLLVGGLMPPSEASMLLRGIRTLPLRMTAHQENAIKIAKFLVHHRFVEKVNHPGLESNPDYKLGKKQLAGYSGIMSFELKGPSKVTRLIDGVKLFKIGVSWGSFESLILSPNVGNNANELIKEHISPGIIRLAIGLENPDALIGDLEQALNQLT